jgi:ABC-type multidrug transport system fused ATPase/permease subunit
VGTHEELLAREDGIYRRLATLQSLDALSAN